MSNEEACLNGVFGALANPTRRDILQRLTVHNLSVGDIAAHYPMSVAAVSKHLAVLETAKLITRHKAGKERIVSIQPETAREAREYLAQYARIQ